MHYYKIIGYGSCPWCKRANSLLLQEKLPFVACWVENSWALVGHYKTIYDMKTVPIVLKVTKSEDTYSSELVGEGQLDGVFQVDSTEVTDNTILVEADAMGTPMSLELKVNENEISGTVMDFEIKGSRIVE